MPGSIKNAKKGLLAGEKYAYKKLRSFKKLHWNMRIMNKPQQPKMYKLTKIKDCIDRVLNNVDNLRLKEYKKNIKYIVSKIQYKRVGRFL